MRTYSRALKIIASITLALHLWCFGPLFQIPTAYAATKSPRTNGQKAESSRQTRQKTTEEKFQDTLDRIREAGEDRAKLKAERSTLETLDAALREQFKETDAKIKNLPDTIKQRHRNFVKKYSESMATLKTHLDDIEKAKTGEEVRVAAEKVRVFLNKSIKRPSHTPLDPNRLPHQNRVLRTKWREPRTTPEQFRKDFPPKRQKNLAANRHEFPRIKKNVTSEFLPQRTQRSQRKDSSQYAVNSSQGKTKNFKPILIAYNGPASDMPLELPRPEASPRMLLSGVGEGWGLPSNATVGGEGAVPNSAFVIPHLGTLSATSYEPSAILLAQATPDLPTPADLSETPEIQFTPELRQIATLLENNPVQLFEFVRNNFSYDPYYGSVRGSQGTLLLQSGNDMDQISTLIGLFRISGIPARYVIGTAEIPVEKVMRWVNVTKPELAAQILVTNGIPAKLGYVGSTLKFIQLERIWAEVYISYSNYRGLINDPTAPKIWIPLDPAFKFIEPNHDAVDLADSQQFDIDNYLTNYLQTVKPTTPAKDYLKNTMDYVTANIPGKRFYDLLVSSTIVDKVLGLLPETLPYPIKTIGAKFSAIPNGYRHRISLEFSDPNTHETILNHTTSWTTVLHNRFTLSYNPATATDEQIIANYGDIYSTPSYLIKVKPVLKVEGITVAEGTAVPMASDIICRMSFIWPDGTIDKAVTNILVAGATYAIGLGSGYTTGRIVTNRTAKLEAAVNAGQTGEPIIGEYLNLFAVNYLQELDSSRKLIAKSMKTLDTNRSAGLMVGVDLGVSWIFGIPKAVDIQGILIDVDYNVATPVSTDGDQTKVKRFQILTGMTSSSLEHTMFEAIIGVEAVSTIKALEVASVQGIPIHRIDSSNISTELPMLQLSGEVKADIQNAVNAGKVVMVSERNIQLNSWNGVGFIVLDPTNGAGAYMISGGMAGGSLTQMTSTLQNWIKGGHLTVTEAAQIIIAHKCVIWFPMPVDGPISSDFDDPRPYGKHGAVDIRVPNWTSVQSVAAGKVIKVEYADPYTSSTGYYVIIDHGAGVTTRYLHNCQINVKQDDIVEEGQTIALSGNTGHIVSSSVSINDPLQYVRCQANSHAGSHVHFELRININGNDEKVDPQLYGKWGKSCGSPQ